MRETRDWICMREEIGGIGSRGKELETPRECDFAFLADEPSQAKPMIYARVVLLITPSQAARQSDTAKEETCTAK